MLGGVLGGGEENAHWSGRPPLLRPTTTSCKYVNKIKINQTRLGTYEY